MILVDVVVKGGQILAAKPTSKVAAPIIMIELVDGVRCPTIKWRSGSCNTLRERLQNRTYGRLRGTAMEKALKVVMENGELNIAGEYGSIEISKKDFEVDLKIQSQRQEKEETKVERIEKQVKLQELGKMIKGL